MDTGVAASCQTDVRSCRRFTRPRRVLVRLWRELPGSHRSSSERRCARSFAASELLVVQPMPSREAAYGFANIGAGLFDLLHVEPS